MTDNGDVTVETEEFTAGAKTLDALADDVRTQSDAAGRITMGNETFGLIGQALAHQIITNAEVLVDELGTLAEACDEHAGGLRKAGERYTGVETNNTHSIDGIGERLGESG